MFMFYAYAGDTCILLVYTLYAHYTRYTVYPIFVAIHTGSHMFTYMYNNGNKPTHMETVDWATKQCDNLQFMEIYVRLITFRKLS